MSISMPSINPTSNYSVSSNTSQPSLNASQLTAAPAANQSSLGTDAYNSTGLPAPIAPSQYGAVDPSQLAQPTDPSQLGLPSQGGQPVQAKSVGGMGTIIGAAGGGLLSWKFLVPMLARTRSLPGLAVAGIIGAGALVGGWISHKILGNL